MRNIAKMLLAMAAVMPTMAVAQHNSSTTPMGKPGSLYAKYGIHRIAAIVSDCIDAHFADPILLANERIAKEAKESPRPLVKFLVTSWVAHNSGGPQMTGVRGWPDSGQIAKSFMMTKEQSKRFHDLILEDSLKHMVPKDDAQKMADLTMEWIAKSKAPTMIPTGEMFKDSSSLYARLGGIAPITLVVDTFVDRLATNPIVAENPRTVEALKSGRITDAGLKFLLIEQIAMATGGPWKYTGRDMKSAHEKVMIGEKEWEVGAGILKGVLDEFKVPAKEQGELFAIIASTKKDIVKGGGKR